MTTLLGWRVTVEDRAHVADSAPAVLMASHKSNLDIVVYGGLYPKRAVVIGKKEIAKIPVFGWFFRATGNILLDRKDLQSAIASIAAAAARVREEKISVWVFPEGHRNGGPTLLPFKKGAFHLAIAAQVPIVPIVCTPLGRPPRRAPPPRLPGPDPPPRPPRDPDGGARRGRPRGARRDGARAGCRKPRTGSPAADAAVR